MKLIDGFGSPFYLRSLGVASGASSGSLKVAAAGGAALPSAFSGLLLTGGFASPVSGKLVIGDGSGWSFNISRRSGGSTTDLMTLKDDGSIGLGPQGGVAWPLLSRDSSDGGFLVQDYLSTGPTTTRLMKVDRSGRATFGVNGVTGAVVSIDPLQYTNSNVYLQTVGDAVSRLQVGHFDDQHVSLPTSQVAPQIKAGVSALYLTSRGDVTSSILFYTGGGSSLAKRWEMSPLGGLIPGANNTYDIGSTTLRVRGLYLGGPLVAGDSALATTATDGFLYVPTVNGTPTGTPVSYGATAALVFDTSTTNGQLWIYKTGAGWRRAALTT